MAYARLPVWGADVRVVEKQEKKPGSAMFSSEKIPVWYLSVDLATDSIARARGVKYETIMARFEGEGEREAFAQWDLLLRAQASQAGVDIEDEIRFRETVTSQRQAAEVIARPPTRQATPVQWGWGDIELYAKKKKQWAQVSSI